MAAITDIEIETELHNRNYFAVSPGPSVPPDPQDKIPSSTPEKQLLNIDPKLLLLGVFGLFLILFE